MATTISTVAVLGPWANLQEGLYINCRTSQDLSRRRAPSPSRSSRSSIGKLRRRSAYLRRSISNMRPPGSGVHAAHHGGQAHDTIMCHVRFAN